MRRQLSRRSAVHYLAAESRPVGDLHSRSAPREPIISRLLQLQLHGTARQLYLRSCPYNDLPIFDHCAFPCSEASMPGVIVQRTSMHAPQPQLFTLCGALWGSITGLDSSGCTATPLRPHRPSSLVLTTWRDTWH